MYSKKVMEHFMNPKNMGRIENADGVGEAGNIKCGDIMKIYIKVDDNKILSDVKFECLGCAVAIANTSLITAMVKGKTLEDALKIGKEDVLRELGEVPATKIHCSVLAADALSEAIYDYCKKNNLTIPEGLIKEHERIKKTVETLEKEYSKHIDFERQNMGKE
ncbi:MAG: iron-sulfur cluster assembly scaffold protein [Candidatus Aenigmatarchaeota archaeon]